MTTIGIIGAGEVGSQIARAADAAGAAAAGDFAIIAYPYKPLDPLPVEAIAGKIVLDTNNYMVWRDGNFPLIDSGRKTVHELRQEQLPRSKIAKAFTHIQAPSLFALARPAGAHDRLALAVSSDYPEAVELVTRLYDQFGFDTVDNSPLSESWRSSPGTPMWQHHVHGQSRAELIRNLRRATRSE
ncbi:NADPH-dependent F420 reductase [Asanoa iriomotensis]|uniref:Pyrroline-5-carboxylate reductase catalytic N-terminal domain-containing protein n=1 Tax=Asanoa iriomotensis TaxID=234613 RepID=A0ABQ4C569_9ACTN|nr:NADP oxidoreductase [Asanoa iriomotensis]GIF57415.1 hypothetical protein Air01nite_35100 [Asanoa iriomotensis]